LHTLSNLANSLVTVWTGKNGTPKTPRKPKNNAEVGVTFNLSSGRYWGEGQVLSWQTDVRGEEGTVST